MLSTLPPSVAAAPTQPHRISTWSVSLSHGGRALTATGSLDWVPGPSPWPWYALVALLVVGVAAMARTARAHRVLAAATLAMLGAAVTHGAGVMLVTAGTLPQRLDALLGADALLVWPVTIVAALLLWRGHTRAGWLSAAVGLVVALTLALDDAPVWWRSSAPSALPATLNRATVAAVVGLGLGLAAALPLLLRRHPAPARPWAGVGARPGLGLEAGAGPHQRPAPGIGDEQVGADVPAGAGGEAGRVASGSVPRRRAVGYLAAGALGAITGAAAGASGAIPRTKEDAGAPPAVTVAFHGVHQAGIATPARPQAHGWVAGFDLSPGVDAAALRELLRRWSEAAAALTAGRALGHSDDAVVAGSGPAALTITVGFGPSLFGQAGLPASARPAALAPLPAFGDERLDPARSGGDLGVVVAAHDAVVVAHAARVLRRLAGGTAKPRWQMHGFNASDGEGPSTPRNLMGQVDGTNNPRPSDPDFPARIFATEPAWMRGGSYVVVRRIRMLLDDWDRLGLAEQESVIGRRRDTGAPLSGGVERTPADFGARDASGAPVIAPTAHMRLAAPAFNEGAAMLRRPFSYTDGDEAGLLFLAWQADPRRGFIPVQRRLAGADALGRFIRHETSAVFAMPGGARPGEYVGQSLLES
jgi:deferrochelatase/peroxidase EfeB